jgi:hypothetical protein
MSLNNNIYALLDNSDLSDDELEFVSNSEQIETTNSEQIETTNNDSINLRKRKQFSGKNKFNKSKKNIKFNKKISKPIYNEIDNLPQDFADAINKKQNLTLKQILILMNLHAIPGLVLNTIHDKLQLKVKRSQIKILHDSRIFYVSYYNWYDLDQIEKIIDTMLFSY